MSRLRIAGDPVIDMTRGETRALQIDERDEAGGVVTRAIGDYAFSSSSPGTVSVGADGTVRAVAEYGGAAITVRSPAGLTATSHVWVQRPPGAPSTYRISFIFSENVPAGWRADFESAARIYERVIRAALPPAALSNPSGVCGTAPGEPPMPALTGVVTGTLVYVGRRNDAGPATGGPCLQRPLPRPTAILGMVSIGRDGNPDPPRLGTRLALHELGHALGLVGVTEVAPSPGFDAATRRHTGPFTLEGYRRAFGTAVPFLQLPAQAHWDFGGDIMSQRNPAVRVTKASAGALMDMGYPAAWYGAY